MLDSPLHEETKKLEKRAEGKFVYSSEAKYKVKTTLKIDETLKKLAQVYAIQNEMTLQEVVELGLKKILL